MADVLGCEQHAAEARDARRGKQEQTDESLHERHCHGAARSASGAIAPVRLQHASRDLSMLVRTRRISSQRTVVRLGVRYS